MKRIILLIALMIPIANIMADSYYYAGGEKIRLVEHSDYVALLSCNKAENMNADGLPIGKEALTLDNCDLKVNVYRSSDFRSERVNMIALAEEDAFVQPCYSDMYGEPVIPTGYMYVRLFKNEDLTLLEESAAAFGCRVVSRNEFMPLWHKLCIDRYQGDGPVDIANALYETGKFASSFPDFAFNAEEISYDPNVCDQWGLYNSEYPDIDINISKAWNYATGKGIKIAIIDGGVDVYHEDLSENMLLHCYNTASKDIEYFHGRPDSHATMCAGIAAAVRNNNSHIAGTAPDSKIMSVSVSLIPHTNMFEELADGINWAWKNGADIISCSWGVGIEDGNIDLITESIENAIRYGRNGMGSVVVKSSGNTGGSITFPGTIPGVVAVGNIKKDGIINEHSSHGPQLHVCAPGTGIISTVPGNKTYIATGTSLAAPYVAGVCALLLERKPNLTSKDISDIIGISARKVGDKPYVKKGYGTWNEYYGYGIVDAYSAIRQIVTQ